MARSAWKPITWLVAVSLITCGWSAVAAAPAQATTSTVAGGYTPLTPARILDTRSGIGASIGAVGPNTTITIQVTNRGGVPSTNVAAAVLNLTVTSPTAAGFITVYPGDATLPNASNLNFGPGETRPNLVTVRVSPLGTAKIKNTSTGTVHLIADVSGWYRSGTPTNAGTFGPLTPARILDTRTGNGAALRPLNPNETVSLQVTGRGGVPASGVGAVVMNVTVTTGTAAGFVTAYPSNVAKPTSSNLNFGPGEVRAHLVTVGVGPTGGVKLTSTSTGTVHLIADVAGYYLGGTATDTGAFVPLTPARLLDSRSSIGTPFGALEPKGTLNVPINGRGGVPATHVGAIVANLTVTQPSSYGLVTAYPSTQALPLASTVNFNVGQTVPNLTILALGTDGYVKLTAGGPGQEHLILDVAGYFIDNTQWPVAQTLLLKWTGINSHALGIATQAQVAQEISLLLGPPVKDSGVIDSCERMILGTGPYARTLWWSNGLQVNFQATTPNNALAPQYLQIWDIRDYTPQPPKVVLPAGSSWRSSFATLESVYGRSRVYAYGYAVFTDDNMIQYWADESSALPSNVTNDFRVCD